MPNRPALAAVVQAELTTERRSASYGWLFSPGGPGSASRRGIDMRKHWWKIAVVLMLAAMALYVSSLDESITPVEPVDEPPATAE